MNLSTPEAPTDPVPKSRVRDAVVAGGVMTATGVVLAGAFFPLMFNHWESYDDEGMFLLSLRQVLEHHGSLYTDIWADKYGPFYYFVMSSLYRLIHQQPSLENGRWIVLVLTVASAMLFGAAVWRVTKNLPCAILCEVATFLVLISGAGNEPMHPGSLGVLLVALVAFELSSYAVTRHRVHLVVVGAAAGAATMTKLNVGLLVFVAIVAAFVVGNSNIPRTLRLAVAALSLLGPLALVVQNVSASWVATLTFVVVATVAATCFVMWIDELSLPRWSLRSAAWGAIGAGVASFAFPLATGTPLSALFTGVFIRPLNQSQQLTIPANVPLNWFVVLLTAVGMVALVALRARPTDAIRSYSTGAYALLAVVGLWLLGHTTALTIPGRPTAEWLPALALLPAIAFCSHSPEPVRLALRCLVLLAALQVMVMYPVAGTQVVWGTVPMIVPCAIALAVGIDHISVWRVSSPETKVIVTAVACLALVIASGQWPLGLWSSYLQSPKLDLPGTGLMRIDPDTTAEVQQVSHALRADCDTFYGVPDENSFYIFSGIPELTGALVDRPIALTVRQQIQVASAMQAATAANERVCILRDSSQGTVLLPGPLNDALAPYTSVVATVGELHDFDARLRGDGVKAVILAGGLGTRLREETEFRPKPMVEIGGQPILWHIMKIFSHYAINDFIVCIGYRGDVVKDYFANYETRSNDFTVRLGATREIEFHEAHREANWRVSVVDTGQETMTGGRVKRVEPFVANERCMVTYGDGLADVDIDALLAFHEQHGRLATMTAVRPVTRFGLVDLSGDGTVRQFREKPRGEEYVNGGFFVFEPGVIERYLDPDCVLEHEPLEALAKDGQLMAYRHEGYWQPMDTYREFMLLEELWASGNAPWKVWDA